MVKQDRQTVGKQKEYGVNVGRAFQKHHLFSFLDMSQSNYPKLTDVPALVLEGDILCTVSWAKKMGNQGLL